MKIKITDAEALKAGITPGTPCDTIDGKPGWGTLVLPLLKAKGVPADYLEHPNDMRCVPIERHSDDDPDKAGVVFLVEDPSVF